MVMGVLMKMGVAIGDSLEMVIQMAMVIQMGVEIQVEMGNHPEEKNLLEEMENQVEVVGDHTLVMVMGVGMGPLLLHQILHYLEKEHIEGPDLFM